MAESKPDIQWLKETIPTIPGHSKFYKFICFMLGRRKRKFTYEEWYIFLREFNKNRDNYKTIAMNAIVRIYYANNNRFPDGINNYDEQR